MIDSYINESRIIDPRLRVRGDDDGIDVIDQVRLNQRQPHSVTARHIAVRLENNQPVVIALRRIQRLMPAELLPPWCNDHHSSTGLVVGADDSITRAPDGAAVHW